MSTFSELSDKSNLNSTSEPNKPTEFKILIKQYVQLLQFKMNTDDMKFKKKYHSDEYTNELANYVPTFHEEYPFLFKMIISGDKLEMLDIFLDTMTDIDNGKKTLGAARQDLGIILHDKYVGDKLNSKNI